MADLVGDWMLKTGIGFVEERKSNIDREDKYDKIERSPQFVYQLLEFHEQCTELVRERFANAAVYKQKVILLFSSLFIPNYYDWIIHLPCCYDYDNDL